MNEAVLDRFPAPPEVAIRPCRREDPPALEWLGRFAGQRAFFAATHATPVRGEAKMLLAGAGGCPVGPAGIELPVAGQAGGEYAGEIRAVRVFPFLPSGGIGARLLAAAERVLRERGARRAELLVPLDRPAVRRFDERQGGRTPSAGALVRRPGPPGCGVRPFFRLEKPLCAPTDSESAGPSAM